MTPCPDGQAVPIRLLTSIGCLALLHGQQTTLLEGIDRTLDAPG
ncbi:hypothetical protein [Halomonas eurihalina]|nr:hypothetical protein [Halomonas eurihalina]MDR5858190.1 hypothetical protein [Halomonas eurihalina]